MTNLERLKQLYEDKAKNGLVDVKFAWMERAKTATAEELAGEILAMNDAIAAGHSRPLDFGDGTLTDAQVAELRSAILEDARL